MPQHLHIEENVKGHIWNWAHHGRMMPYTSSAQDQGNAWRIKAVSAARATGPDISQFYIFYMVIYFNI